MNKPVFKRTLVALGLLALVSVVGAQTYYTHELIERVAAIAPATGHDTVPAAPDTGQWDPARADTGQWDSFAAIQAEMERMQTGMDEMFSHAFQGFNHSGVKGPVSEDKITLKEHGDKFVVTADIPGARERDINVNLNGRVLSITAESSADEQQHADQGKVLREAHYASTFQQAFTLPGPVNAAGMHTRYKDGVLTVTIPKATS